MTAGAALICPLLANIEDLTFENFRSTYKELVEKFLFNNFPLVRKAINEEFYLFLLSKGDVIFDENDSMELSEYISSMDVLEENEIYLLFKQRWEQIINPQ